MPKTEESCKTGTSQDFKRRTHQYIHFIFLVISVVRLWLLYHNKAPWNYQVLMVASREFWPFFLTEYATRKIRELCFKGGAQWWRSNTSESCLYKNPKRLSSVRQGLSQNPKRLLKSEQSTVGGEVDKNMMWALGKSILKSLFSSVHTMSAYNKASLLWVPQKAEAQQEELTLLRGH